MNKIVVVLCLRRFLCCWIISVPGGGEYKQGVVGCWEAVIRYAFLDSVGLRWWRYFGLRMRPIYHAPECTQVGSYGIATVYLPKVFGLLFLLIDDLHAGCAG